MYSVFKNTHIKINTARRDTVYRYKISNTKSENDTLLG